MPIVDGQYEAKISTTFRSTKEALEAIKDKIEKSRRVRISNVPMKLLDKLVPLLRGKDVKIILPRNGKVIGKNVGNRSDAQWLTQIYRKAKLT